MVKNRYSLRTNIGYFLNKPIGFNRDFSIDYPEIFIDPDLNVRLLKGFFRFSRTREGLLLEAEIEGQIEAVCGRCLTEYFTHVKTKFEELYIFTQRSQEDTDMIVPMDGYIDLGEIFREYLLLELPINPVCQSSCKGLCDQCGQNLNLAICEHYQKTHNGQQF